MGPNNESQLIAQNQKTTVAHILRRIVIHGILPQINKLRPIFGMLNVQTCQNHPKIQTLGDFRMDKCAALL